MAALAGVRVQGLNAVVRDLQRFGVDVEDLKDAFSGLAAEGAVLAARYAPKKSGRLAGDVRGNRAKSKAVVTAGRKSVPYAGPINYGWPARHIAASGFMQRASDVMEPRAVSELERAINKQIRRRGLS